jgi:hypothetical protein
LIRAFNETRIGNYEFSVAAAIEWVLSLHQETKSKKPEFGTVEPTRKVNFIFV